VRLQVVPPPLDEPSRRPKGMSPRQWAESLSHFKARCVARMGYQDDCILAADTVCALGDRVIGKAADADEARLILHELSHNPHQVITGVTVLTPGRRRIASDSTTVFMHPMTDEQIDAYIESGEWIGKAGAYAIQETADRYVDRIEGSFTNVVGLPMELVLQMLERAQQNA
jgi:septum formation protein